MDKRKRIFKALLSAIILIATASCSEWTDVESIKLNEPTIEGQNPELYAQYLKALDEFKASDHQVVIVSVDNISTTTTSRSQHLTDMPDSLDYICLNNTQKVNQINVSEMKEVRRLGTKILGLVDFDAIENAWKKQLEEETTNATLTPESDETEKEEEIDETAIHFIEYCKSEVIKQITANTTLEVDGIVVNYTGVDLNVLTGENEISAETARQGAFFDAIANWKVANTNKDLIFKGFPQNVINKELLSDCKYIIVNAHNAKNTYEMSYLILMACAKDVPTDRFIIGVTTPYLTNSGSYNGELGDGSSAILGAAQWAVAKTVDYTKAGISIDAAEQDYFNVSNVYPKLKEAISILNPTIN